MKGHSPGVVDFCGHAPVHDEPSARWAGSLATVAFPGPTQLLLSQKPKTQMPLGSQREAEDLGWVDTMPNMAPLKASKNSAFCMWEYEHRITKFHNFFKKSQKYKFM